MVEWIFNVLVFVINTVIWLFASVLNLVFSFLPDSPFLSIVTTLDASIGDYLSYLNWFIPIPKMLGILAIWLSAMLIYYIYSVVMRWLKMIE